MKALLVVLLVVLIPVGLWAQPDTLWTHVYLELHPGQPQDMQPSFDGGLVWTGMWLTGADSMNGHGDLIAREADEQGETRWTFHVEGVTDDTIWYGQSLCRTADSCYMILGGRHYGDSADCVLFKLNRQGELLWRRTCPVSDFDLAKSIGALENDTYAVCMTSTVHDPSGYDYQVNLVAKLTADGDTLWTYSYPGNPVRAVPVTGGCILLGKTTYPLLVKLDEDGQVVWLREYTNISVDDFMDLVELPSGYFVLGQGWSYGSDNVSLMNVGFDGEPVTIRQFIPEGGRDERPVRMARSADGGLMIGGYSMSVEDFDVPMMLIKTDSLGARQWRTLTDPGWQAAVTAFCGLPDGGYVLGGAAASGGGGFSYGFLARFGETPNHLNETVSLAAVPSLAQNYPNPFNARTEIAFDLPRTGVVRLAVYDLLGRAVAQEVDEVMTAGHHTITFDGAPLASGIYFYTLQTADLKATRKMMLLK
ncbi:MAG TPA: T9SS type A sorting domain-containing protein [bacterium]